MTIHQRIHSNNSPITPRWWSGPQTHPFPFIRTMESNRFMVKIWEMYWKLHLYWPSSKSGSVHSTKNKNISHSLSNFRFQYIFDWITQKCGKIHIRCRSSTAAKVKWLQLYVSITTFVSFCIFKTFFFVLSFLTREFGNVSSSAFSSPLSVVHWGWNKNSI